MVAHVKQDLAPQLVSKYDSRESVRSIPSPQHKPIKYSAYAQSLYTFHLLSCTSSLCLYLSSPSMIPFRPHFRLSITFASLNPLSNLLLSAITQSVSPYLPISQYSILLLLLSSLPFESDPALLHSTATSGYQFFAVSQRSLAFTLVFFTPLAYFSINTIFFQQV